MDLTFQITKPQDLDAVKQNEDQLLQRKAILLLNLLKIEIEEFLLDGWTSQEPFFVIDAEELSNEGLMAFSAQMQEETGWVFKFIPLPDGNRLFVIIDPSRPPTLLEEVSSETDCCGGDCHSCEESETCEDSTVTSQELILSHGHAHDHSHDHCHDEDHPSYPHSHAHGTEPEGE